MVIGIRHPVSDDQVQQGRESGDGNRGNEIPQTDANFDIPLKQEGVNELVVVGKGGQGVLLLNGLLTGIASVQGESAVAMVGYGALQRGGGVTLSIKSSKEKIRD